MNTVLEARGVALPDRLQPTDFALRSGELTMLAGPNGGGKTSLLHALARIGRPTGQVLVNGVDIDRLTPEKRCRHITYLPASRDVAWPLLARDIIALGLPNAGSADAVLEALEIAPLAGRRMDRLSTGERARVLLARALAAAPHVLLLDEPAANLDPLWQIRIMARLKAEAQAGRAVLMAAHDLDSAAAHADRLVVISEGRVVADGKPADILEGPVIPAIFGVRRRAGIWVPA